MPEDSIDVLMRIVGPRGAMMAESATQFTVGNSSNALALGFEPGRFCELREFDLSAGIDGSAEKRKKKAKKAAAEAAAKENLPRTAEQRRAEIVRSQDKKVGARDKDVSLEMQPVEYTRVMDCASTQLFQALVQCDTLDEINIVKRKAAGTRNSGEVYLRLDFKQVLITELDWKDSSHVILETGSFIYREVVIRYRPQKDDGSLGTIVQSHWKMRATRTGG